MPERDDEPYVSTSVAAAAIGVTRGTLVRWWNDGTVTPALLTPGGHARWDIDDLRKQLRAKRRGENGDAG
jgi:predicted site-specific integrase-resolvase